MERLALFFCARCERESVGLNSKRTKERATKLRDLERRLRVRSALRARGP
jgi:hypothetical protein